MVRCVAVWCGVLQCVTVCCSVVQCVAVCCSVVQCVAVCCSVLQCVAQVVVGLFGRSVFFFVGLGTIAEKIVFVGLYSYL